MKVEVFRFTHTLVKLRLTELLFSITAAISKESEGRWRPL